MKNLKYSIFFKMGIIFLLIMILMIPTSMIQGLINERENIQRYAISEVSSKWGDGQTISGPFISIPFVRYEKRTQEDSEKIISVEVKDWIHILPESLKVSGSVKPEKRTRGIYEVVVYESKLKIKGSFRSISLDKFDIDIDPNNIRFDKATLNLGITDPKGIENQLSVRWNEQDMPFNSGTSTTNVVSSGISTKVPLLNDHKTRYTFSTEIELKGSQHLYFTPVGKTTDIDITSTWNTPSFTGEFLPDRYTLNDDGFRANWNILHLNRSFSQEWTGSKYNIQNSAFGTDLLLPLDNYKKTFRVAKYAVLFLVMTFITFFFVEVMRKVFIHPIQYLLVGIALVIFYTLLLSFGEHVGFNLAYISSAILTLSLITLYTFAIVKSKPVSLLISGLLTILYSFIFIIIQLVDYALLMGSIGMFLILGLVMYFSRKIDWYNTKIGGVDDSE